MDDLYEILRQMRERPGMYFRGGKNLAYVENFIMGFKAGRQGTNKEKDVGIERRFYGYEGCFAMFVADKYKDEVQTKSWASIIEAHTESDEEAFDVFLKLLDEFLATKSAASD